MAKTPIPLEPVRARLVTASGIVDDPDELDDDEFDDEPDDDEIDPEDDPDKDDEPDEDDDEVDTSEADVHAVPWSPVPTAIARRFVAKNPDAAIEIVFPTVYEEDRSVKLKDLGTAAALGYITHQRAAEQGAKELGFEQYDYVAEMDQIRQEVASMEQGTPDHPIPTAPVAPAPTPNALPRPPQPPHISALDPTRGMKPGPKPGHTDDGVPRRASLAGPAQAAFRKQQRQAESLARTAAILHSTMHEAMRNLAVATAPRAPEAPAIDLAPVTEAVARANFVADRLLALADRVALRPEPAVLEAKAAPAPVTIVESAPLMRKRVERDKAGRITAIVDEPLR